jgi:hypothetical protein
MHVFLACGIIIASAKEKQTLDSTGNNILYLSLGIQHPLAKKKDSKLYILNSILWGICILSNTVVRTSFKFSVHRFIFSCLFSF